MDRRNAARFVALWFVALVTGALVIPGEGRFPAPHSTLGVVSLPLVICIVVLLAASAAFVARVFLAPVLGLWLATYLIVIYGLARLMPSDRSARLAGIVASPVIWILFINAGDRLVNNVSLAVACIYGLLALPSTTGGSPSQTAKPREVV